MHPFAYRPAGDEHRTCYTGQTRKVSFFVDTSYRKFPVLWNKLQYIFSLVLWNRFEKSPLSKEQTTSISLLSAFIRIFFYTTCWRNSLIFWKSRRNIFVLWNQPKEFPSNCKQAKGINLILLSECGVVQFNFSIFLPSTPTEPVSSFHKIYWIKHFKHFSIPRNVSGFGHFIRLDLIHLTSWDYDFMLVLVAYNCVHVK
jgi:hypothetical protein